MKKERKTRVKKTVKIKQVAQVDEEILPCPFCGSAAVCYVNPWGTGVSCTNKICLADGPTAPKLNSKRSAILIWNTRK